MTDKVKSRRGGEQNGKEMVNKERYETKRGSRQGNLQGWECVRVEGGGGYHEYHEVPGYRDHERTPWLGPRWLRRMRRPVLVHLGGGGRCRQQESRTTEGNLSMVKVRTSWPARS